MVWARFEDSFPEHPKVVGLSDKAFRLHVSAICYSTRNLTDGIVPPAVIPRLGGNRNAVRELAIAGLWEHATDIEPTGWRIHDFLTYNPSREKVERERQGSLQRQAKSRGKSRDSHGVTNGVSASAPSRPVPNPIPFPDPPPPTPPPLGDDDGFRERYGTLAVAFGDPRERRLIDEFVQIANDATLEEIREGIAVVRRAGQKPYPSKVWAAISELRTPAEAAQSLEDFMESMYEPA